MIQVYTGDGKGKTTAACGLALRAAGAGLKVYIAQFLKGRECGETKELRKIKNLKIEQFGTAKFVKKISKKDIELAKKGLQAIEQIIRQKKYDVIILDEIFCAINLGLLSLEDVLRIIKRTPKEVEIVLTGRNAPPEITECSDLVSEIKQIKHYFCKGIKGRKGIEY